MWRQAQEASVGLKTTTGPPEVSVAALASVVSKKCFLSTDFIKSQLARLVVALSYCWSDWLKSDGDRWFIQSHAK